MTSMRWRWVASVVTGLIAHTCASAMSVADASTNPGALPVYTVVDDTIPTPLSDRPGNARNGLAVFLDRDRGHCLLCHRVSSVDEPFHGTLGPDLSMVAERLSKGQLRLRLVDSTRLNADVVMPAYYRVHKLHRVGKAYRGKPVLTAQDIEDLVAYLRTLRKGPQ